MAENSRKKAGFVWDEIKLKLAEAVAKGDRSLNDILTEFSIPERTFYRWKKHPEFQQKIDEIIQDIDIAQKAERIKIAKKIIQAKIKDENPEKWSKKDLLEWLQYIGEEVGDKPPQKLEVGVKIIDNIPPNKENKKSDEK